MSSPRIVRAQPVTSRERWLEAARASSHATFFHTPHWQELAHLHRAGLRDLSMEFELSDGSTAYLPLTQVGSRLGGLLKRAMSTFAGCYGGAVSSQHSPALERTIQEYLAGHRFAEVTLIGNPLAESNGWIPAFERSPLTTQMLRLDGNFEALLRAFSKGHRAAYKKAQRLGITVSSASAEQQEQYLALYQRALGRWGARATSSYSPAFFRGIFALARQLPEVAKIWVASEADGDVIAGGVFFYWNKHVGYWHGISNPDRYADSATTGLLGEVIRDACGRGLEWFDFNPSGGHEGVAAFKKHFGAVELDIGKGCYKAPAARLARALRGML